MSSFAYKYGVPIFLTNGGPGASSDQRVLPSAAKDLLMGRGAWADATVYVPGGTGAVSDASVAGLKVTRLVADGAITDGYDTSNAIAEYMVANGFLSAGVACVANGADAPKGVDALAGAAMAGKCGGVMLLANGNAGIGGVDTVVVEGFIADNADAIDRVFILGGSYVMPNSLVVNIEEVLE